MRCALVLLVAAGPAWAEPVLSRVALSQGGVGQYEFTADVTGAATLTLDVPLNQVDDVLKSLRVQGEIFSVRLPGRQPLEEAFRTLPFQPGALASADALLAVLKGEAVRLPASGLTGSILAVSAFMVALPDKGAETRHRLTIATATGIDTVVLEEAGAVEFTSAPLRAQITTALTAMAEARAQDRRPVQVVLADGPARHVQFSYVTAAPVWKASYRLTTLADGATAQLQGYAVVENFSGQAWHGVDVVLTSGQPVLYHQALYTALFNTRPEAPVDGPGLLQPRLDQGSMPLAASRAMPMPAAPSPKLQAMIVETKVVPRPVEAQQNAVQVSFRLAARVDAAAGETLLLPIIDRSFPAQRVALYQSDTEPLHPLVSLLLRNDSDAALPAGLASLYEQGAFMGDARLPTLQPGEDRLASFAADLAARVEESDEETTLVTSAHAARGVLEFQQRSQLIITIRITAPPGSGRTVLIEQPARPGYELTEPRDGVVKTPDGYRITRPVAAGATEAVRIVFSNPAQSQITLSDAEPEMLAGFAANGQLDPKLRAGVQRLMDQRADLGRTQAALKILQDRRAAIVTDQDRLRSNLAAVPPQGELQRRYLAQMLIQENELASLQTQTKAVQGAVDQADAALKDAILNFKA